MERVSGVPAGISAEVSSSPMPTKLETFLRARRLKPARLARAMGRSRGYLALVRMGRIPSDKYKQGVAAACEKLTGEKVTVDDLF
jgi:hypothetical protein